MLKKIKRKIKHIILALSAVGLVQNSIAQQGFEGILTTRVSIAGTDMSAIIEKINYQKGHIQEQMASLYKTIPAPDLSKLKAVMEKSPMMGMVLAMTPPKATIYIKNEIAVAKTKGLGYEIQHYHNEQSDEAFLYTQSLIQPGETVTAFYKPSQGYKALFAENKRITPEHFNIEHSSKSADVAGYSCAISTYTPKNLQPAPGSEMGIPTVQVHKLIVYTSKNLPKGTNFSHPYYLPEDHGIMRIDIYLDDSNQPSMIYEIVSVKNTAVSEDMLVAKKTEPLYELSDMNYGMKLLGIMMGGMSAFGGEDEE